jgi:hypothetical protein
MSSRAAPVVNGSRAVGRSGTDRQRTLSWLSGADGGDVVPRLPRAGLRFRGVDDVEDLGTTEAGDLHASHVRRVLLVA